MKVITFKECQKIKGTLPPIKGHTNHERTSAIKHAFIKKPMKIPPTWAPLMNLSDHVMPPTLYTLPPPCTHSVITASSSKDGSPAATWWPAAWLTRSWHWKSPCWAWMQDKCNRMGNIPKYHPCCTIYTWTNHPKNESTGISIKNMQFLHCLLSLQYFPMLAQHMWHHPRKRFGCQW